MLSSKLNYNDWSCRIQIKLRALAYEAVDDCLEWRYPEEPSARGYISKLHAAETALRLLYVYISPYLFDSRDLTYRTEVEILWKEIFDWAKSASPAKCLTCANLKRVPKSSRNNMLDQTSTLSDFYSGSKRGCVTCRNILDALEAFDPGLSHSKIAKELIAITIRQVPDGKSPLVLCVSGSATPAGVASSFYLDIVDTDTGE